MRCRFPYFFRLIGPHQHRRHPIFIIPLSFKEKPLADQKKAYYNADANRIKPH